MHSIIPLRSSFNTNDSQPATNPAAQSSPVGGRPAHAAPASDATLTERIAHCKKLLGDLKSNLLKNEERVELMQSLVKQLPDLPGEKTAGRKVKEAFIHTGAKAVESVFGGLATSQNQIKVNHRTPQAEVFYGLMDHLADQRRLNRPTNTNFLGLKKTSHSGPASFYAPEIQRRRLNAPVWAELIHHASKLKDGRQEKMLDGFEANFTDLPVSPSASQAGAITGMFDAYSESFTKLARMLARPDLESHPDTLSKQEAKALDILEKFAVRLSQPLRQQLISELQAAPAANRDSRPALSNALDGLISTLRNTPANQANQVDAVAGDATQNAPAETQGMSSKVLMNRISGSKGSVSDMVSDMTSLAERLPQLSDMLPSASQPSKRTEAFQLLIHHLAPPTHTQEAKKLWSLKITVRRRELEFDGRHVDRRISVAPVWTKMFSNVGALNPRQQRTLLKRFAENFEVFDLLPQEHAATWAGKKEELLAAYAQSLAKLAEMLPNLAKSNPDVMSDGQQEAIAILRKYGPQLQNVGKVALENIVLTTQKSMNATHPAWLELNHLKNDLKAVPQPV